MSAPNNWKCPYCGHAQALTERRYAHKFHHIPVDGLEAGDVGIEYIAHACANNDCCQLSLHVAVRRGVYRQGSVSIDEDAAPIFEGNLLPQGEGKPQPSFIPIGLREDYREAWLVVDLSPKAAATLARRCLQGMIRDFCGIALPTLNLEIKALRAAYDDGNAPAGVTSETIDAIDHVRTIGNIGAHMEKDIDLIIPVDPDEARALLKLVEMLFGEWYVARHLRQQKLADIKGVAAAKAAIKNGTAVATAETSLTGAAPTHKPEPINPLKS